MAKNDEGTKEILVMHPGGRCYGHLEWGQHGTTLVVDHCECGGCPADVGCAVCGATGLPVTGHRCSVA
jgi:hypothetical protein